LLLALPLPSAFGLAYPPQTALLALVFVLTVMEVLLSLNFVSSALLVVSALISHPILRCQPWCSS
jgi:hypothetical protein